MKGGGENICVRDERTVGWRHFSLSSRYISLLSIFTSIMMDQNISLFSGAVPLRPNLAFVGNSKRDRVNKRDQNKDMSLHCVVNIDTYVASVNPLKVLLENADLVFLLEED